MTFSLKNQGPIFFGKKTKELVHRIPLGSYVLLDHEDIDEMAALSLIQKKVKGVLNYSSSMTGLYPSVGTIRLTEANIPVYDVLEPQQVQAIVQQGDLITIMNQQLWIHKSKGPAFISTLYDYNQEHIQDKLALAKKNLTESLKSFTQNTLTYAYSEMHEIVKPIQLPPLRVDMQNRHVVVVTRGSSYIEDLKAIKGYIRDKNPIFIGVDGGADAILECGYRPHIILGDMDSVSVQALHTGAEIIVHAYADGSAPGVEVIRKHGVATHLFPCFGTSEDAAHLLAYESGALLIVTLGSHTNMVDFLEKGRKGMGSTLLVRLKIGEKLVDAKGVSYLYPVKTPYRYISKIRSFFGLA